LSRSDIVVELLGETVTIYRLTEGATDDYGYPAETWSQVGSEKAIIQPTRGALFKQYDGLEGEIDTADYVAYLLSTTSIQEGDYLVWRGEKYDVVKLYQHEGRDGLVHYEASLRRMEGQ